MAEEELKKAILGRIQKEKEDILGQSRKDCDDILKQVRIEASSLREGYLREIEKKCLLEKTKELNRMNLQLKRQLQEAKEEKISQVLSLVEDNLKTVQKNRDHYKSIFRNLLTESLKILDKDRLKLKVNPSDEQIAKDILKDFKQDLQLESRESVDSGLIISDLEENTIILNTFGSRLRKLYPELRQGISKVLFKDL